jgi:hypothetical protein
MKQEMLGMDRAAQCSAMQRWNGRQCWRSPAMQWWLRRMETERETEGRERREEL